MPGPFRFSTTEPDMAMPDQLLQDPMMFLHLLSESDQLLHQRDRFIHGGDSQCGKQTIQVG